MTATLTGPPVAPAAARRLSDVHAEVRRLQATGRLDEAILLMRRLVAAVPGEAQLVRDLCVLLRRAQRGSDADRVLLRVEPGNTAAWRRLAGYARKRGTQAEFEWALTGWQAADPDNSVAAHFLAALRSERGEAAPERAPGQYVRELFDSYADRFDAHLASLGYCVPEAAARVVADWIERHDQGIRTRVVDLGCGTGLVGDALGRHADRVGTLVGVDLSSGMLRKAAERAWPGVHDRRLYDELVEAELTDYLSTRPSEADVIVSADVLIYLGDLGPVFDAAFGALRPGGQFVFSVERADPATVPSSPGYRLASTGRFEHRTDVLEAQLTRAGFVDVTMSDVVARYERREPVAGVLTTAVRPAG